jgi:hypothetical protein
MLACWVEEGRYAKPRCLRPTLTFAAKAVPFPGASKACVMCDGVYQAAELQNGKMLKMRLLRAIDSHSRIHRERPPFNLVMSVFVRRQ